MNKMLQIFLPLTIAISLIVILIFAYSPLPFEALSVFFTINTTSIWYFGNTLDKMGLILFASVGASFAFKAGLFNLGGEGQIYLAAFITSVMLEKSMGNASFLYFVFVLAVVLSVLFILGAFLGILKALYNIEELISSFLLSSIISSILNFLIISKMKGSDTQLLATSKIASTYFMKGFLFPSTLNISFIFSILFCILIYSFFEKTKAGYHIKIAGSASEFAKFSGLNTQKITILSFGFSTLSHALVGFFAVVGTYHLCHINFPHNFGWAAIAVSLIAKNNIILLIPSAFLYAYVINASSAIVAKNLITFDTSIFFQASTFLLISAEFITKYKFNRTKNIKSINS